MSDRTIPASQRRREEARRQGHIPRSGNLTAAVVLLILAVALLTVGDYFAGTLASLLRSGLPASPQLQLDQALVVDRIFAAATQVFLGAGLIVGLMYIAALATDLMQSGFLLTLEPLLFQWSRLSPAGNLNGQRFGRRLGSAFGHTVKVGLVAALVCWNLLRKRGETLAASTSTDLSGFLGASLSESLLQIAAVLLIVGFVDFLIVRRWHELAMRMTPDQAREEQRQSGRSAVPRRRH
ncbi:Flagellar biosynthetic protein FlhB [Maioricimonas rarisocia]|uniref:Flagellar biosynthetic protein FlhB n=1 Tax=Maioricimonas rarisocia TaxID=2528026 RepID=A0A517ZE07_9PLAN|nr:EscU/YscU/HrcU family type III secretion system export apparatus switch protein [Maioricimonas rarisocia]QDU40694.1 Flagellar biosynthetic protein FlhB [Maioricimonas rarisocia]